jgi:hypothetical protein
MVGHKLGEFAPTRLFRGHTGNNKIDKKAPVPSGGPGGPGAGGPGGGGGSSGGGGGGGGSGGPRGGK